MHVADWKKTLSEICRTAAESVIIDFPPRAGFAGLAPWIHPILQALKSQYQPYRVFSIREIISEFHHNGFTPRYIDRHVVLPFGLHRLMGSVEFTRFTESLLHRLGLRDILGAPVTIFAERTNGK
jgi:hypothetical protein